MIIIILIIIGLGILYGLFYILKAPIKSINPNHDDKLTINSLYEDNTNSLKSTIDSSQNPEAIKQLLYEEV